MGIYSHKKIVIWGLGTHGGGLASALYFLKQGIFIYILDDKSEELLKESLDQLKPYQSLYQLSVTQEKILKEADLVIKNPAIRRTHPYLKLCKNIQTDISLFLEINTNPLIAITGTKGKSSLATYVKQILKLADSECLLGGNITRSPLSFTNELNGKSAVILELSSWQLGDLSPKSLRAHIAILTNIYHDHQNTYDHFDDYIKDKLTLVENQSQEDCFFCEEQAYFQHVLRLKPKNSSKLFLFPSFKSFLEGAISLNCNLFMVNQEVCWRESSAHKPVVLFTLPLNDIPIISYTKFLAGAVAIIYGLTRRLVENALNLSFSLEHRLEWVLFKRGVNYYNDSAATMPEATLVSALSLLRNYSSIVLITGGTDKQLDFSCFEPLVDKPIKWILLEGSASVKIKQVLETKGMNFILKPTLKACVAKAGAIAKEGWAVLFSPASASFEKFHDEFDRGRQFKDLLALL